MIGTVSYMAPEQFQGGEIDALCDIWAYGLSITNSSLDIIRSTRLNQVLLSTTSLR